MRKELQMDDPDVEEQRYQEIQLKRKYGQRVDTDTDLILQRIVQV